MRAITPKLFLSGFLATFVVTMVLLPFFRDGLPKFELATLIASLFTSLPTEPYSTAWWLGVAEHCFNGTVLFPFLYIATLGRVFPTSPLLGGLLWGVLLWAVSRALLLPLAGYGPFASHVYDPVVFGVLTFLIHAIYGLIFGAVLGFAPARKTRVDGLPGAEELRRSA